MEAVLLPARRKFLFISLVGAGVLTAEQVRPASVTALLVPNVTGLYTVTVAKIVQPKTAKEVADAIGQWTGAVSIGGARFSMGGQVGIRGGLHLDMRAMNAIVWLDAPRRRVRVQAGILWRDLQDIIDRHDLSIKTMQSYSNFSVGGSVSVNAHGRYVGNGPIAYSVRALQLVLADGSIIETNSDVNNELFRGAIGGYGALGVITEIELELVENLPMERLVQKIPLEQYVDFFNATIVQDAANIMHNADLIPPYFDAPTAITWRTSKKPLTEKLRLVPKGQSYTLEKNIIWALTELPFSEKLRKKVINPLLLEEEKVVWRNHEASLDAAELEPRTRIMSTYILQEYFIPARHFLSFAKGMAKVLRAHEVEVLNVSIRHAKADVISLMPWAKEEVFSFVIYFKQRTYSGAITRVEKWTRELIQLALDSEGRYYLPYQLHATKKQFEAAYPEVSQLRELKKVYDPKRKMMNELWHKYL